MKYPLLGSWLAVLFLGSVSVQADDPLNTRDLRPELAKYDGKILVNREYDARLKGSCLLTHVELAGRDPVDGSTQLSWFYTYQPMRGKITAGKALIQPPTGGITDLDRGYAETLCNKGVPTALVETWSGYREVNAHDFGTHDRAALRAIATTRYVIEYLKAPVVLMGTSLGAIYSSMVMGLDARVKAAVLIVGGGPLYDVLLDTDQEILATLRDQRMQEFAIGSRDEYARILRRNVRLNPGDFASPARKDDLLVIVGNKDTTVKTSAQFALWQAWGQPELIEYPFGHLSTIILEYIFSKGRVMEFMSERAGSAR